LQEHWMIIIYNNMERLELVKTRKSCFQLYRMYRSLLDVGHHSNTLFNVTGTCWSKQHRSSWQNRSDSLSFLERNNLAVPLTLLVLAACGGGGGTADQNQPAKTTATLKISITGALPTGSAIAGADFTLTLPANMTPTFSNGVLASDVVANSVTFAGSTFTPLVTYSAASGNIPGTLRVILTHSATNGITQVGEAATITLQLANGAVPTVASFGIGTDSVIDALLYNSAIGGMGVAVASVTLQ
jgi:hypothetical protein